MAINHEIEAAPALVQRSTKLTCPISPKFKTDYILRKRAKSSFAASTASTFSRQPKVCNAENSASKKIKLEVEGAYSVHPNQEVTFKEAITKSNSQGTSALIGRSNARVTNSLNTKQSLNVSDSSKDKLMNKCPQKLLSKPKLTVPVSPKFTKSRKVIRDSQNNLPKAPLKIATQIRPSSSKPLTKPMPFNFKCDARGAKYQQSACEKQKEIQPFSTSQQSKSRSKPSMITSKAPFKIKPVEFMPTKVNPPNLSLDTRLKKRHLFDEKMQEKEKIQTQQRQELVLVKQQKEQEEIKRRRLDAQFHSTPVPDFGNPPVIVKSSKPLTEPKSPRLLSKMRTMQHNN